MQLEETFVSRDDKFDGHVVNLHVDTVRLPNGHESTREVVSHPGAVAVVVLDDEDNVFMVDQFRYPLGETLLEIPAGKLEPGEEPFEALKREQREETGTRAEKYVDLGVIYPTVGYCDERIYVWACRVTEVLEDLCLDDDEFLEVRKVPLAELERRILAGEIRDGKTQIALLKTANLVRAGRL